MWDACSDATISFGKSDLSEDVSYIVENDLILDGLTRETRKCSENNITINYQSRIASYELPKYGNGLAKVVLADGSQFSANLVV